MTDEQAIYELKEDCALMDVECNCKDKMCDDCHISSAIKALKLKIAMNAGEEIMPESH